MARPFDASRFLAQWGGFQSAERWSVTAFVRVPGNAPHGGENGFVRLAVRHWERRVWAGKMGSFGIFGLGLCRGCAGVDLSG